MRVSSDEGCLCAHTSVVTGVRMHAANPRCCRASDGVIRESEKVCVRLSWPIGPAFGAAMIP